MPYVSLEGLYRDNRTSIYKLVLIAAARGNELAQGAQPLVKCSSKKVSTIAMQEIAAEKVRYEDAKPKGKKSSS